MMFVCLAFRHTQISLDLMMESDSFFFFFNRVREKERKKKMETGTEGQRSQALLISFLLCFLAFFFLFPSHIQKH